jgi:hypothetical protein
MRLLIAVFCFFPISPLPKKGKRGRREKKRKKRGKRKRTMLPDIIPFSWFSQKGCPLIVKGNLAFFGTTGSLKVTRSY